MFSFERKMEGKDLFDFGNIAKIKQKSLPSIFRSYLREIIEIVDNRAYVHE